MKCKWILHYETVQCQPLQSLSGCVKVAMDKKWQPFGSPYFNKETGNLEQAVVIYCYKKDCEDHTHSFIHTNQDNQIEGAPVVSDVETEEKPTNPDFSKDAALVPEELEEGKEDSKT